MQIDLQAHADNDHWVLVTRSQIGSKKTIKTLWSFKRKRRLDGSILKHKETRLCAHGGMQLYGENYWDAYTPVVNWVSVRMMLL